MIKNYINKLIAEKREGGMASAAVESVRLPYKKSLQMSDKFLDSGENIYHKDWELLIIVDACRYDLMVEVLDERNFDHTDNFDSIYSVDSATAMWMRKTFVSEFSSEISQTVYVCGNPYSRHELNKNNFELLDEVWSYAWDDSLGTLPARPVTDKAISIARSNQPDRLIVHYLQPHCPFINNMDISRRKTTDEYGANNHGSDVWEQLRRGEVTKEEVWEGYKNNLHYVLDDVELLLENISMDNVVLTSDHGNALGERGLYGHPWRMPVSCLRTVPWIRLSAEDLKYYKPDIEQQENTSGNVQDRLKALGYQ